MSEAVTIVGGCGHVGLPLGIALANAGTRVALLDTDPNRVAAVRNGTMPFLEHDADDALADALASGRLTATTDPAAVAAAGAVIVTIGTPVDEFLDPRVRSFDRAIDGVLAGMHPGQLMILRSTVFPGVTDRLGRRLADAGAGIDLAYCPERIAQGYALRELPVLPQIVGAFTPAAHKRAAAVFGVLGMPVLTATTREAELAKLFANSYRYINFAIANQLYLIAQKFGVDFHRVYDIVVEQYPRLAGFPRPGFTGGPCLLKDTMQLAAFNHNAFAIGQAAMMVNEGLPAALVDAVKAGRDLRNDTVAILGMAFKGNADDIRDSLAYKLRKVLSLECKEVLCTDPYIADPSFVPLSEALERADLVFVGACHDQYRDLKLTQPVVDVFRFVGTAAKPAAARRAA